MTMKNSSDTIRSITAILVSDITTTEVNSFDALTNGILISITHDQPPWRSKKNTSKTLTCGRLKGKKKNVANLL
jgi:hypothetical protein